MQKIDLEEWSKLATQEVTDEQLDKFVKPFGDESPLKKFKYDLTKEDYDTNSLFFPVNLPNQTKVKTEEKPKEIIKESMNLQDQEEVHRLEKIKKETIEKKKEEEKKKIEEERRKKEEEMSKEQIVATEEKNVKSEDKKDVKLKSETVKQEFKNLKQEDKKIKLDEGVIEIPTLYNQDWKLGSNQICIELENQDLNDDDIEIYGALKENLEIFFNDRTPPQDFVDRFKKLHQDTLEIIYHRSKVKPAFQDPNERSSSFQIEKKKPTLLNTSSTDGDIKSENVTSFCVNAIQKILKNSPKTEEKEIAQAIGGKPSEYESKSTVGGYSAIGSGTSKRKAKEQAIGSLFVKIVKDGKFPKDIVRQSLKWFPHLSDYL